MRNKFIAILIIFIISAPSLRVYIHAQENLKSALKEAMQKIEMIGEIKEKENLSVKEKIEMEIQTRKEALLKIFEFTLLEDENLKNKLTGIKNLNQIQEQIREVLLNALKENENAHQEMQKRLENAKTLDEVKQLATDFKNWRALVHNPKMEKIIAFTLIFQEKNVLKISQDRLEKIKIDLEKLEKMKILKKEEISGYLAEAVANLEKAVALNRQAEDTLFLILAKEVTLIAPTEEIQNEENKETPSVKSLVEESLKYVKETYGSFIKISKLVKEKIGIQ
jgi:hypothetical protein